MQICFIMAQYRSTLQNIMLAIIFAILLWTSFEIDRVDGARQIRQKEGECVTCEENSRWMERLQVLTRKADQMQRRYSNIDASLTELEDCDCVKRWTKQWRQNNGDQSSLLSVIVGLIVIIAIVVVFTWMSMLEWLGWRASKNIHSNIMLLLVYDNSIWLA